MNRKAFITLWTLTHIIIGILAWMMGISFSWTFFLHCLYEIIEATQYILNCDTWINQHAKLWEPSIDPVCTSWMDTLFCMAGWYLADTVATIASQ